MPIERVLSISYGKDSIACIPACEQLGWKIDRAVHVEIMATPTIPADLPPMMEFKKKADEIILERYGIKVEHIHAPLSYDEYFHCVFQKGKNKGRIYGFPMQRGAWCNSRLKMSVLGKLNKADIIQYIGIAADEPARFHNITERKLSPLVEAGWDEAMCRKWCDENGLLSPIYTNAARGGVLVLPQPRRGTVAPTPNGLPGILETYAEVGCRKPYHIQKRRSDRPRLRHTILA